MMMDRVIGGLLALLLLAGVIDLLLFGVLSPIDEPLLEGMFDALTVVVFD